jgi:hypothetical protein
MKIVGTSSNGGSQGKGGKLHFEVDTKAPMVDIINMKVNFMEVDKEILEEEEVEEVVEVMVEVIEVNNQITTHIVTIAGNLGTWQRTVMKRNMMHKMEKNTTMEFSIN